eukprot:s3415_g7.t1
MWCAKSQLQLLHFVNTCEKDLQHLPAVLLDFTGTATSKSSSTEALCFKMIKLLAAASVSTDAAADRTVDVMESPASLTEVGVPRPALIKKPTFVDAISKTSEVASQSSTPRVTSVTPGAASSMQMWKPPSPRQLPSGLAGCLCSVQSNAREELDEDTKQIVDSPTLEAALAASDAALGKGRLGNGDYSNWQWRDHAAEEGHQLLRYSSHSLQPDGPQVSDVVHSKSWQDWGYFSYELLLLCRHLLREGPALDQVANLIPICRVRLGINSRLHHHIVELSRPTSESLSPLDVRYRAALLLRLWSHWETFEYSTVADPSKDWTAQWICVQLRILRGSLGLSSETLKQCPGETQGSTPEPEKKEEDKDQKEKSEYTYSEGEEEEEPKVADQTGEAAPPPVEGDKPREDVERKPEGEGETSASTPRGEAREESAKRPRQTIHPNFNKNYLTRRLQLYPCVKSSAKGKRSDDQRRSPERSSGGRGGQEGTPREGRRARSRSRRSRHRDRDSPPERSPIARRPQPPRDRDKKKKKKKKNNKGAKRRERGRQYQLWEEVDKPRRRGRPAGRDEAVSPWSQGLEQELWRVAPMELGPGTLLVITEGDYFGARVKFAGEVTKLEVEHGESTVLLKAKGTDNEGILKASSARPQQLFRGHICPAGCGKLDSGDYVIHCIKGRKLNPGQDEPWTGNLEGQPPPDAGEDELGHLRERSAELLRNAEKEKAAPGGAQGGGSPKNVDSSPAKSHEEKKKKKSKKEKKRAKEVTGGKHPAIAAQKELRDLYAGTGLDPREKVRRKVLGRAQRFAARKKAKSDSEQCDSGGVQGPRDGVCRGEQSPGDCGEIPWDPDSRGSHGYEASAVDDAREMLNISAALDHLLRGRVASAADILAQRLKAQESVTQGTAWSVALRMEVPPPEHSSLVTRTELQQARREDYSEAQARWRSQASGGGKSEGKNKSKGNKGDNPWKKDEREDNRGKAKGKSQEKK